MIEPEVAFNDTHDNMKLQEDYVSFLVQRVLERRGAELKEVERDVSKLETVKPRFPRIDYTDAVATLQKKGSSVQWGDDLGAEDEALLVEGYDRPIFVMNYPKEAKVFGEFRVQLRRGRHCGRGAVLGHLQRPQADPVYRHRHQWRDRHWQPAVAGLRGLLCRTGL